jgi:hypothetical protein
MGHDEYSDQQGRQACEHTDRELEHELYPAN